MKSRKRKRNRSLTALLSVLMIFMLVFASIPQMTAPVCADESLSSGSVTSDLVLGSEVLKTNAGNDGGARLWYAGRRWIVMGYDTSGLMRLRRRGAVTVWQESVFEKTIYNNNLAQNSYDGSILQSVVNSLLYGGSRQIFSEKEQAAIMPRDITHPEINQVFLWPLAFNELSGLKESQRITGEGNDYWLRQDQVSGPGYAKASYLPGDGGLPDQTGVTQKKYARPAFDLSKDAILFTSKGHDGKESGTIGANALKEVGTSQDTDWKVTLKDNTYSISVTSTEITQAVIKVEYEVGKYGTNDYISAILVNEAGKIAYYGRVAKATAASGTLEINVKGKFAPTDKLYIFNEQYNGDEKTDFAGELVEIPLPECVSLSLRWSSIDGDDLMDPVVISGVIKGTTIEDALYDAGYYFSNPPFTKEGYRSYNRYTPQPIASYASYAAMDAASADLADTITGDTTLYYAMAKEIGSVDIEVTAPACGTETATGNPDFPWAGQTNPPQIAIPDTAGYILNTDSGTLPAVWIQGPNTLNSFAGTFEGGNDYYLRFALSAEFGYRFAGDAACNVAGGTMENPDRYGSGYEGSIRVTAVHVWKDWEERLDETGHYRIRSCNHCDAFQRIEIEDPDCLHAERRQIAKIEPSCTDAGYEAYEQCTQCGVYIVRIEGAETVVTAQNLDQYIAKLTIPALGHSYKWEVTEEATCTSTGKKTGTCQRCHSQETQTIDIDPDAHDWGEWTLTADPTCTDPGTETRVCSRNSDHKETRQTVIDPDAHSWGEASYEWSDDNLTVKASRTCRNDHDHMQEETADVEIEIITPATVDAPGEKKYAATFQNTAFVMQTKILPYTLVYHSVKFNTNCSSSEISEQTIEHEEKAAKPSDPAKDGYDFEGWYVDDGTFGTEWNFEKDRVMSDTDLIARYSFTVVFEDSGTPVDSVRVYEDKKDELEIPETVPEKEGYVFDGWAKEDGTLFDFNSDEASPGLVLAAMYHRYAYKGNEQTWYLGDTNDLPFRFVRIEFVSSEEESNKDLEKLFEENGRQLFVDETLLESNQYTYEKGSLIVKIVPFYLNTLSVGQHTLTVKFADGEASAIFYIKERSKPSEPENKETATPDFVFPRTGVE